MSEVKLLLPEKTADLSPAQQGWLTMAEIKKQTFDDLQKNELEVQGFLNNITADTEWESVKEKLTKGKQLAGEGKDRRLFFTRIIDEKLYTPAMAFEKRNEELVKAATGHELTLRIAANTKAQEGQGKATELVTFRTHVQNEWFRIAGQYRADLADAITMQYKAALKDKLNKKELTALLRSIKEDLLPIVKRTPMAKFTNVLINQEEMMAEYKKIPTYDGKDDLAAAIKSVDEKFALYAQDVKNADEAIKNADLQQQQLEQTINSEVEQNSAVNTLTSQAQSLELTGGPSVKHVWQVVEDNSDVWAIAVMGTFLKHWMTVKQYVKVKTWAKLSIGQMAEALGKHITDTGKQLEGIKTFEVKK